mgnify:CR=1 FL=1
MQAFINRPLSWQPDSSGYPTGAKASEAEGAGAAEQSYLHCQASQPARRGVGADSRACPRGILSFFRLY